MGGAKSLPRTEVTKKIWAYIKKNGLNDGRTIKPDATLKGVFPVASLDMFKMAGFVSKHLSWDLGPGSRVAAARAALAYERMGYSPFPDSYLNFCRCISHAHSSGGEA